MIVADYIALHAEEYPNKIAITCGDNRITYAELSHQIELWANSLYLNFHLESQSRVILFACKSINFVVCYFALHKLNVIVLPVDVDISVSAFSHICQEATPSLVIGEVIPQKYEGNFVSFHDLDLLVSERESNVLNSPVPIDSIADIMFTSGTTGNPKGVMLSHGNLLFSAMHITAFVGNTSDDVEVLALPICHSFGLGRLRSVLYTGGTVVFYNGFFNVKGLFQTMQNCAVTGFSMVPASWKILQKLSGEKISVFSSLRYIEFGSARLLPEDKQHLLNLFPQTRLCMHYGLTEASRTLFMEFHTDPLDCIGYVTDGIKVKVVDENEEELNDGEVGEICVQGAHVTAGYWNDMQSFKSMLCNNYFKTGDIGYKKGKYFYLTGRVKDIVNVGGKKVSTAEVEEVVKTFEGIEECACVGVSDDTFGEQMKLFIVASNKGLDLSSLKEYLVHHLERYKVPRFYELVGSLPKTINGKIKKYLLK